MKSGYFFASNLAIMNDKNEKELHPNNSESVHALCFCNSNTEKIPMWYLYGGITGKGCALGVTPAKMRDWIRMIKEVYVVVEEDGEKKPRSQTGTIRWKRRLFGMWLGVLSKGKI